MHDIIERSNGSAIGSHLPALPVLDHVTVRAATKEDLAWVDALQKTEKRGLGFQYMQALEKRAGSGELLIAEVEREGTEARRHEATEGSDASDGVSGSATSCLRASVPSCLRVGYVMGSDRYFKRDDVGIIYQMAVLPEYRRSLVAATLLKAFFDRSAYGVKLYCCWCAQDLEANRFWEAMGFVPIAFRTGGGRTKKAGPRVHVLWEKPIRGEDVAALGRGEFSGWWMPSKTGAGSIGEDRIVLPIPEGVHWQDEMPVLLPEVPRELMEVGETQKKLGVKVSNEVLKKAEAELAKASAAREAAEKKARGEAAAGSVGTGGLRLAPRAGETGAVEEAKAAEKEAMKLLKAASKEKKMAKQGPMKHSPEMEAAARELKDRWLEMVEDRPGVIAQRLEGKYAVTRLLGAGPMLEVGMIEGVGVRRLGAGKAA